MTALPQPPTGGAVITTNPAVRVLLIDPYAPLRDLVAELLTDAEMQVVGAHSDPTHLQEAVDEATRRYGGVDVVVLDARLPHHNGLRAAQQLRQLAPKAAVVLHTALAGQLGSAPRTAGVCAEVPKGSPPQQLIDTINHAYQATQVAVAHTR